MKFFSLVLIVIAGFVVYDVNSAGLKEEFTWTFINYDWPENTTECSQLGSRSNNVFPTYHQAPKRGSYRFKNRIGKEEDVPEYTLENNVPMGATRYKNRLFITIPRRLPGIPSTLNYVDLDCPVRHNVPLKPYPSWEINALNAQRPANPTDVSTPIVSVYRTTVDACDRLWFVDMGMLEYPTGRQQIQQFAIVVVDLKTDQIIRRIPFSTDDANPLATLASVTVDVTANTCDDAFAYVPDLVNYKTLVYSWKQKDIWKVTHNYFICDQLSGDFDIGGHKFQWSDGIFSITLSKINKDGYRTAFFHHMAGTKEFAVSTRILRDRQLATRSYHENDFKLVGDRGKDGQTSTHELHQQSGVMILGEISKNGFYCWNVNRPLTPENQGLIQVDAQKMIYPSDVKIDGDDVWMMTNSAPISMYGTLNYEEINFRVWTNSIKDAVAGTPCARS